MCRKFGNHWLEYGMDRPSNMENGLCQYQEGTTKWIYNVIENLMVDLETLIVLASMTYTTYLDVYELHPRDEKANNFLNGC